MKVLYIYSGTRFDKFKGTIGADYPDTQFYGMNHLKKFGVEAEFKEAQDVPVLGSVAPYLPFAVKHALVTVYFALKGEYDVIFGSSVLYALVLKRFFRFKQKFVLLDISLSRTIESSKKSAAKLDFLCRALFGASAIVSVSRFQKAKLMEHLPSIKEKLFSVPLGVDVAYHKPTFEGRSNFILSAGRDNGRDYKTVCEVAKLLPQEKFVIICSPRNMLGIGPIPANVMVCFDIPHKEWFETFRSAKMLLLITHDDAFGDGSDCSGQTALLDAMATGLPVIVSRKKYVEEYVTDGKDAFVVNCYDAPGIADEVRRIQPHELVEVARSARSSAEQKFSTEKMAEQLAIIFKNIK